MKYNILSLVAFAVVMGGVGMSADTAHAMNKAELVEAIASQAGLSKADSKKALDGSTVGYERRAKALKKGDRLSRTGVDNRNERAGVRAEEAVEVAFSISKRSARTGRNPQTGKEIQIAAEDSAEFKAGAELSKAVN